MVNEQSSGLENNIAVGRWFMLSLGWLLYFIFGLISTSTAPLAAPVMGDLGLTYTEMGVVMGAWQLVYIFSAQPLGLITDRIGVYRSLLLGIVIISASSLLRGVARGFWTLFSSVALFGLGGPLISIGTPKLVSIWFRGEERGTASGINASGSILGSVAALTFTSSHAIPLAGNWRNVFLLYGVIGISVTIIWLSLGKDRPYSELNTETEEVHKEDLDGEASSYIQLLRVSEIWILIGIGVVFFLSTHALKNWLPRILELKGYKSVEAGYAASLLSLAGLLGNLTVPRLSYKLDSNRLVLAIVLISSATSISLIAIGGGNLLWLGILVAGFSIRSLMPLLTLTMMEMPMIGSRRLGAAAGLLFSIGEVGGFLGPSLTGYFKDLTGSFQTGVLMLSLTNIIAIAPLYYLKAEQGG